jgi:hypothetical protein
MSRMRSSVAWATQGKVAVASAAKNIATEDDAPGLEAVHLEETNSYV